MIVEGGVIIVFGDSGICIINEVDVLEIQLPKQDPTLNEIKLDGVNALEVMEPLVLPYLDDYANPFVAPIIYQMDFYQGMGLGQTQQGIPTLPQFKEQKNRHGLGVQTRERER